MNCLLLSHSNRIDIYRLLLNFELIKVCEQVTTRTNRRASEINQGYENGTSWAFEFGREFQICPIIVEDLAYPGHMLIEVFIFRIKVISYFITCMYPSTFFLAYMATADVMQ